MTDEQRARGHQNFKVSATLTSNTNKHRSRTMGDIDFRAIVRDHLGMDEPMDLATSDLDLMRQWFDAVQDVTPQYLEAKDFALARRLYEHLGMRVPDSIIEGQGDG